MHFKLFIAAALLLGPSAFAAPLVSRAPGTTLNTFSMDIEVCRKPDKDDWQTPKKCQTMSTSVTPSTYVDLFLVEAPNGVPLLKKLKAPKEYKCKLFENPGCTGNWWILEYDGTSISDKISSVQCSPVKPPPASKAGTKKTRRRLAD
ncbi:hypothetical protein C8J56DRAFT_66324 [Mycena floridula]|nr:hypothetical protein C8J56DRAFT_66324 [Mycena floridula]